MLCERCKGPIINHPESEGLCAICEVEVTMYFLDRIAEMNDEELEQLLYDCDEVIAERIKEGKIKLN